MQKEKSIGRNILIVVLILVTIASVCAGLFAWAKYQSTITGTATGETAKWSFDVSNKGTSIQNIDFPISRTDNNTSVAEGKIAPGTYGELELVINATGTETALMYTIEGRLDNLPTNIKFYSDEERTLDLTVLDNVFSKSGYMKLNEVGQITETIYWEWPFEIITCPKITDEKLTSLGIDKTEYSALITAKKFVQANDMIDTAESDKQVSMSVSVTGKQINANPVLADLVQVGDYVNYNASSNGEQTFTSADCKSGACSISSTISTNEEFNSEAAQWKVLSVDRETKVVELVSVDSTAQTLTLHGGNGFSNSTEILDGVGAIYGKGKGATSGRSIKIQDINKYSSYDANKENPKYKIEITYNNSQMQLYQEQKDNQGNITGYAKSITKPSTDSTITMTYTYFVLSKAERYFTNNTICNMLFNKSNIYWVNEQCVKTDSNNVEFGVRLVDNNSLSAHFFFFSSGTNGYPGYHIRPVVSLESNIKTTGKVGNVWQLQVD
ncbi:MAG: hypothetical protein E7313_08010 [Clostridiales bacterium]|nr:hypothetical protein [Clostridiales bacterium]